MPDETTSMAARPGGTARHLTTRRGFVAAVSLGAVSLYGLWAAHGAAPFRLFGGDGHEPGHASAPDAAAQEPAAEAAGHGGHGGHGATARGSAVEEFRRETEAFIARYRQPDGSVLVGAEAAPGASMASGSDHGAHGAHGAGHEMPAVAGPVAAGGAPAVIYLLAQQWSFEPDVLRLRAGTPYRFRMMAVDVAHGASLQLGRGSRIIRLRPGVLVDQEITFTRPGEYLLYCTLFCGIGHDRMSGRITVT